MKKYDHYKILNPAGEWENWRVPTFLSPADVAKHLPYSTICMFIPRSYQLYGKSPSGESVKMVGPCWTVWNRQKQDHVGPFPDPESLPHRTLWAAEGPQVVQEVPA